MIVQKQIENFKQELHKEIDSIFQIKNQDDPDLNLTMTDFSKKSEQFYKKYYKLCKDTNDVLFENDLSIPLVQKERYREQRTDRALLKYDSKIMPLLETLNMLSSPGTHEFANFSIILSESIKFLFTCYSFIYSMYLPKWLHKAEDIKKLNEPSLQLKRLLNHIAVDLVLCFQEANITSAAKIPLIMLYGSEVQDRINIKVAEYLSADEIAYKVAEKVLHQHNGNLDMSTYLDSLVETNNFEKGDNNEHLQIAYHRLIKIMVDIFMSNLTSHLIASPLKPKVLTTETKMKLIDLKHGLIRELEQEFDRIK